MDRAEKQSILNKAKDFFRDVIAKNHNKNTKKLMELKEFNINPFTHRYLANYLTGNNSPESLAKAIVYPRVLGTSISTSFGSNTQVFCSDVLDGFGSVVQGIDIEFIDQIDGRKKYCQIKSGPDTINKDDVTTIINHFDGVKNLARQNNLAITFTDLMVGVLYGTPDRLNTHYRVLQKEYPVYVGKDFWHRLTGDQRFYYDLAEAFGEIAHEFNGVELIDEIIAKLAEQLS